MKLNRILVRFKDFQHYRRNFGLLFAMKKSLRFMYSRARGIGGTKINSHKTRKIIILTDGEFDKSSLYKRLSANMDRVIFRNFNNIVYTRLAEVEKSDRLIILCTSEAKLKHALDARAQRFENRLVITRELADTLTERVVSLYVDHVIGSDYPWPGFSGNLVDELDAFLEFYSSLWLHSNKSYGLLNFEVRDVAMPILLENIEVAREFTMKVSYDKKKLKTKGARTFNQVISQNEIKIEKISEDLFWHYNLFTQEPDKTKNNNLLQFLQKGVFVRGESS